MVEKLDMLENVLIVDIITEYIMTHPIITNDFIDHLLKAPDRELDACTFKFISEWKMYVDSVDILYVLDICARYSLASGFMMKTLDLLLQETAKLEGKSLMVDSGVLKKEQVEIKLFCENANPETHTFDDEGMIDGSWPYGCLMMWFDDALHEMERSVKNGD